MDAGADDIDVHGTIIYGKDFAGSVSLAGTGKNVQMIIKPVGSSGTEDPANQRSTIASKIKGYTATILQDAFGVRIEHAVSA
jgi:N4-gp56 family major capsid protein